MKARSRRIGILVLLAVVVTFSDVLVARAAVVLGRLQVEYRDTPLGIDVEKPRFSWQMTATAGERGSRQTAYRILVRDPKGTVAWDTGRLESDLSLGVAYAGHPSAATRYRWTVTVWDQTAATATGSSWFETGLMSPAPGSSAWSGAEWIGGGDEDLVLYSPYLTIFDLSYTVTIGQGSTRASFVYGANDARLMEKNKNIYQIASGKDQSYIKLELDVGGVGGSDHGKAKLNVYRAGYKDTDTPSKPLQTFDVSTEIVNDANKHARHVVQLSSAFGRLNISMDGRPEITGAPPPPPGRGPPPGFGGPPGPPRTSINLNRVGAGGNFIPFGMLCDMGFSVDAGQNASFGDLVVSNTRFPNQGRKPGLAASLHLPRLSVRRDHGHRRPASPKGGGGSRHELRESADGGLQDVAGSSARSIP